MLDTSAAHDRQVHLDELAEPHRLERLHHAAERLTGLRTAGHAGQRRLDRREPAQRGDLEYPRRRVGANAGRAELRRHRRAIEALDLVDRLICRHELRLRDAGPE